MEENLETKILKVFTHFGLSDSDAQDILHELKERFSNDSTQRISMTSKDCLIIANVENRNLTITHTPSLDVAGVSIVQPDTKSSLADFGKLPDEIFKSYALDNV